MAMTPRLIEDDVRLFVSLEGHDATLAATVVDAKDYGPEEILYGMRYVGTISVTAEGHPTADLGQLSKIEPDIGAEPPQVGWADAT